MSILLAVWLIPVLLACALLMSATHLKILQRSPQLYTELAAALLLAGLPFVWIVPLDWPAKIILFFIHVWLLLLPIRLLFGRLNKQFLYGSTWVNCLLGMVAMGIVLAGLYILHISQGSLGERHTTALLCIATAGGLVMLRQLLWTLRHYKLREPPKYVPLKDLPTVSLCVPARNETNVLEACLQAAVASDYPKLEIVVLDDCSQDKTSHIIRTFAHDGVRFVQGTVPAEGWLGRNQAMATLADVATGEYLIFIGVDTRLAPQSITHTIQYALRHNIAMMTALPQNRLGFVPGAVFGTMQYFWRVAVPFTKRRLPVSSKYWLIKADAMRSLGGFASVRQKVVPEESFARRLFAQDSYRFIIGSDAFGITTAKKWSSQAETAIRLLYPMCKRQPFFVLGAVMAILGFMVAPFVVVVIGLATGGFTGVFWLGVACTLLLFANYVLVLWRTHPRTWLLAALLLPVALVQEIVLLIVSMTQYEFGTVNWKGRNVCYPVIAQSVRPVTQTAKPE